jgi:hypothetical protein
MRSFHAEIIIMTATGGNIPPKHNIIVQSVTIDTTIICHPQRGYIFFIFEESVLDHLLLNGMIQSLVIINISIDHLPQCRTSEVYVGYDRSSRRWLFTR